MHNQNPLKNLLYNYSVPLPMIKHKDMIQDQLNTQLATVVEVRLVMTTKNIIILNIDNDLLQELAIIRIKLLLLHITPDLVMTTITEILAHIVHHIGLLLDHLTDVIHVPDTNLDPTPEMITFQDTLPLFDHLSYEIGYNTIKPIHSKITAIHKIPSPTGKVAFMSFFGALNFYTKFIEKLHINLKPFYNRLHENTPWKWTDDH